MRDINWTYSSTLVGSNLTSLSAKYKGRFDVQNKPQSSFGCGSKSTRMQMEICKKHK